MKYLTGLLLVLISLPVRAQTVTNPAPVALACANNTVVPSPTSGQFFYVQCDSSGKLITSSSSPFNGSGQVPYAGVYSASVNNPGIGAVPGDVLTPAGGTTVTLAGYLASAQIVTVQTQVAALPTINAAGASCAGSLGTLTGTTGTGTKFQVTASFSAGAVTAITAISVAGSYSVNPTSLAAEPVTGASCVGATLNLTNSMGALGLFIQQSGSYSVLPSLIANAPTTTGAGTGLTLNLVALPLAAYVPPGTFDTNFPGILGDNSYYGYKAGSSLTTGAENTFFGSSAGAANTTGGFNSFFGTSAGIFMTTGSTNTAIGNDSLRNLVNGSGITAVGANTLKAAAASTNNISAITAVGSGAMVNWNNTNSNPYNIVAVGSGAGAGAVNATYLRLTAVGANSGAVLSSGSDNSLFGYLTGNKLTSGGFNTIVGSQVGSATLTTGVRNILIGTASNTDATSSGMNDTIIIGASTLTTPWLTGSLVAASMTATFGGTLTSTGLVTANNGVTVAAGQLNVTSMTQTSAAQSGTVCYNSGTGAITYDATLGCLTSTLEAKTDWLDMAPEQALAIVSKLRTGTYTYKPGLGLPEGPQVGFAAEQVANIDDRLVGYRPDGTLGGVRYQQTSALYAAAIAQLKADNDNLLACMNSWKCRIFGIR